MKQTWIFGDVHGEYDKLLEILALAPIQKGDRIISLGDLVDRGPKSFEIIDHLIKMKNDYEMIFIKGNHDDCFYQGLLNGNYLLYNQGCKETLQSYIKNCNPDRELVSKMSGVSTDFCLEDIPVSHYDFFKNQLLYYIDEEHNCFVHGGFDRHHLIKDQAYEADLIWDRDLWMAALSYSQMKNNEYAFKMKDKFKEVFIGHTPTVYYNLTKPMQAANIWNLDTGCGKGDYPLTIMNLQTKEYYQSNER